MNVTKESCLKEYSYKKGYYLLSVLGPNIMMAGMLVWAVLDRIAGNHNLIGSMIIMVVPVLLFSSFVAMNHPVRIEDDGKKIVLHGFFQQHEYDWSEISYLRIRKFIMTDRVFIRIGEERVRGGRYWIDVDSMQGSSELLEKMIPYDSEYALNNLRKKSAK